MKGYIVHNFLISTEIKAGIAERAIKTLKGKYFKYMSHKQTFHYIDIVDQVTRLQSLISQDNQDEACGCNPSQ